MRRGRLRPSLWTLRLRHHSELMAHAFSLGSKITDVVRCGDDGQGDASDDVEAVPVEAAVLRWIIRTGPQGEDVPRPVQVLRAGGRGTKGGGPVRGRDSSARSHGVDGDCERGAVRVGVVADHEWQPQGVSSLRGQGRADDARAVPDDEGHLLLGHQLGRDDEISLVLPVGVVDDASTMRPAASAATARCTTAAGSS